MKISEIIKKSVLETNKQLKKKDRIVYSKKFQILGKDSSLDSFVIVNLFIAIDDKVKSLTGRDINLLNEDFLKDAFKKKYTIGDLEKDLSKKIKYGW
tara:strand:+ start:4435 stop:4725 length:291 start_codon:yes stop_codon:yes gene_type:complete